MPLENRPADSEAQVPAQGLVKALEEIVDAGVLTDGSATEADLGWALVEKMRDIARAALSAQGKDDGWFRIDDPENPAPTDGTQLLLVNEEQPSQIGIGMYSEFRGQPFLWDWGWVTTPTHWRPTPAPPSTPSREV